MINVVMLVKNRSSLTEQALTSLITHTVGDFNLTIVDDESIRSDKISNHLRVLYPGLDCTVLRINNSRGITGQARNLGIYFAEKYWGRGDWLYLSDNDVYFTEGWDEKLIGLLCAAELASGTTGRPILGVLAGSTHPFHGANHIWKLPECTLHTHDAVSGYSQLMRWKTWDKYGPLDAHAPGIRQSEDFAFCQKIIKDGGVVGSIDPPVVYDCGLTDTFGNPAIGVEQIPRYEGIIQE